jgi:hypothetical protein
VVEEIKGHLGNKMSAVLANVNVNIEKLARHKRFAEYQREKQNVDVEIRWLKDLSANILIRATSTPNPQQQELSETSLRTHTHADIFATRKLRIKKTAAQALPAADSADGNETAIARKIYVYTFSVPEMMVTVRAHVTDLHMCLEFDKAMKEIARIGVCDYSSLTQAGSTYLTSQQPSSGISSQQSSDENDPLMANYAVSQSQTDVTALPHDQCHTSTETAETKIELLERQRCAVDVCQQGVSALVTATSGGRRLFPAEIFKKENGIFDKLRSESNKSSKERPAAPITITPTKSPNKKKMKQRSPGDAKNKSIGPCPLPKSQSLSCLPKRLTQISDASANGKKGSLVQRKLDFGLKVP